MRLFSSLKGLEDQLRKCDKVSVSEEAKLRLKKQIMAQIKEKSQSVLHKQSEKNALGEVAFGFEGLIVKLKEYASQVVPDHYFRVLLKEKLVALMEFEKRKARGFFGLFSRMPQKRVFASVLTVVFVFATIFSFTYKIERAEASSVTVLESVNGDVTIIRGGQEFAATAGFLLKADDSVRTGPESKASIRFLDQSVSRLDENTEVKISRLFVNPTNKTQTVVELVLRQGRLWARVINLVDNLSKFQVKAENTIAVAKKKAAFDVSVSAKKQAKVSAIQNNVDLVVATNRKVVETTLVKGFSAEVKTENSSSAPKIVPEKGLTAAEDTWVQDNLEEDKAYIETVKQEVEEGLRDQAENLPGSALYAVKKFSEGANLVFTFDEFDKKAKILIQAEEKLGQAQAYLEKGEPEKAQATLQDFQNVLQGILAWAKEAEAAYPDESFRLRMAVSELLNLYDKKLAIILPNETLYPLKQAVSQMKVLVAETPAEKTEEKMKQAEEKLLEAHDLVENGDTAGAAQQIEAYTGAMSEVVSEVQKLPEDEKEKAVSVLIDTKADDLKVLQSMVTSVSQKISVPQEVSQPLMDSEVEISSDASLEKEPLAPSGSLLPGVDGSVPPADSSGLSTAPASPSTELEKQVLNAKTETLIKLGETVLEASQAQPSPEVIQKIQDLKAIDINGKPLVNMTVSKDKVIIRSSGTSILVPPLPSPPIVRPAAPEPTPIVTPTTPPPTTSSGILGLPLVQP